MRVIACAANQARWRCRPLAILLPPSGLSVRKVRRRSKLESRDDGLRVKWGIRRTAVILMLLSWVNESKHTRRIQKLILDPGQTSFGFTVQEKPATVATEEPSPATKKRARKKSPCLKSAPPAAQRAPVRARISFEAPGRLKRKLERAARDRDRSKTALLRAALESYLRRPHVEDEE